MKQRYDLFAISLLLFAAIFVVWIVALPAGADWIKFVAALIAAISVIVGVRTTRRQMQLAARGREQDRLEKELPGLRKAFELAMRFKELTEPTEILKEFEFFGARTLMGADFEDQIEKMIPSSPYVVRAELSKELMKFRQGAQRLDKAKRDSDAASYDPRYTGKEMRANWERRKAEAESEHEKAEEEFKRCVEEMRGVYENLGAQVTADEKRRQILRAEQNKLLGI
ncbi:hypothetical protein [Bradyrhizobium sp. AZCC 1610]|uniref:hypothetical protein n=1 Tax=Bradyrhizobium sp. AZCC 1610 TaxID=3117020 RepID=UPI002FEE95F0